MNLEPDMEARTMFYCYFLQAPKFVMKRSKPVLELRLFQVFPFKNLQIDSASSLNVELLSRELLPCVLPLYRT